MNGVATANVTSESSTTFMHISYSVSTAEIGCVGPENAHWQSLDPGTAFPTPTTMK